MKKFQLSWGAGSPLGVIGEMQAGLLPDSSRRAVQLPPGHRKVESVRYLGIEVDHALAIADQWTSES